MTRRKRHVQRGLPAGKLSATFLQCSVKQLVLFVFRCRSIIHEECGHGKRMLITFELSVVLWKKTKFGQSVLTSERLRVFLEIKFFYTHSMQRASFFTCRCTTPAFKILACTILRLNYSKD